MAGRAEKYLRPMLAPNEWGWWLKNSTDMTEFGLVEPGVDFTLSLATIQIEAKNTNRSGRLEDKPTKTQIEQLNEHGGFIFLVMWDKGYPRLPGGADAYLVPWEAYKDFLAKTNAPGKSVRRTGAPRAFGADELLEEYKVAWNNGRFSIPSGHAFWDEIIARSEKLNNQIDQIKAWRKLCSKQKK